MKYTVYRFEFPTGVHFGDGALWDSINTLRADTVFSALCIEMLNYKGAAGIEELAVAAKSGSLVLSDMFPYSGEDYYLPKPILPIKRERGDDDENSSVLKKSFKKLKYVPVKDWNAYLEGSLNPVKAAEQLGNLGKSEIRTMSSLRSEEKIEEGDALPFPVGVYNFNKDNGLYLIAGYEDENIKNILDILFKGLKYSGIGGKKSAGLGSFELGNAELPTEISALLNKKSGKRHMTLSVCMANSDELDHAVKGATYLLQKRAGYVYSQNYAPELRRKKDFYSFGAGSCFENRFKGGVFDVKGNGSHPVYRYAVPMWMEID